MIVSVEIVVCDFERGPPSIHVKFGAGGFAGAIIGCKTWVQVSCGNGVLGDYTQGALRPGMNEVEVKFAVSHHQIETTQSLRIIHLREQGAGPFAGLLHPATVGKCVGGFEIRGLSGADILFFFAAEFESLAYFARAHFGFFLPAGSQRLGHCSGS